MISSFQLTKVEVDLSLDTAAYASGDVLADTQVVTLGTHLPDVGRKGTIESITVLDKDDQAGLFDLVILDSNVSLGTENAAPSITDANAASVVAIVPVSGYTDLGANAIARPSFDPIPFVLAAGVQLYVGAISRDTKTYTAAGLRLKFAIRIENVADQAH